MKEHGKTRRQLLTGLLACTSFPILEAWAQSFPSAEAIRLLIGFSAGGATDTVGRLVARNMATELGQSVIAVNQPGAGGIVAAQAAAKAPATGYTTMMLSNSTAIAFALRNMPDDLSRDFAPISLLATGALVLAVTASSPVRSVKDLIAMAASRPGKIHFSHDGVGGVSHLGGAMFNLMAGVDLNFIPYKGGSDSAIALAGGNVDVSLLSFPAAIPMIEANKIRAIAVSTMARSPLMPSLPTIDESGVPGYDRPIWVGLLAPAGTPNNVLTLLNAAVAKSMSSTEVKEAIRRHGMEAVASTPEELAAAIRSEINRSEKLAKTTGIKIE